MSQTETILAMLRHAGPGGITQRDAIREVACYRLAARIADAKLLLEPDEEITTLRVTANGKTFGRYVLRRRVLRQEQLLTLWENL